MRVFMLGWEFPPHISGGLGTACLGLTQGLVHHGVEVTFVVPRVHGDEPAGHLELVGLRGPDPEGGAGAGPGPDAAAPAPPAEPVEAGKMSLLGIDSPLRPYATTATWAAADDDAAVSAPEAAAPVDARGWALRVADLVAGDAKAAEDAPFTGAYGKDLHAEVERYARVVLAASRQATFDLVHAHDWMTFPAAVAVARASGRPLVVHVHATEYDRGGEDPDPRVREIEQFGLDEADLVVTVSHFTAGLLQTRYGVDPAKVRVVHNAVHVLPRPHGRMPRTIPEPVVLFLGRITFQKGPDQFLDAAQRVVRVQPDVKFVISGSGDLLPGLVERAAKLGLARNVHFTGFLRGEDVERMYALADVYVMPSVSEPFGIAPLEAMALDVPVIVSRQSGVAEVLRHALKVDFWDVEGLADKILAVLTRPALRTYLRQAGRDEVRAMQWDLRGAHLKRIYEELVT